MFRRVILEAPEVFVANLAGDNVVETLVGRKPIGTCGELSKGDECIETRHAHPIGFLGECLDHQYLILLSPLAHPRVRVNHRADKLNDVLLLPSFVMKRHSTSRQRLYNSPDVDFRPTGETYVKMWEGKFDQLLHEIEYDLPRRWHPKSVWAFIQRVHDDIRWAVIGQCERLLEALNQDVISGLVRAVVVSHVCAVKYIAANIGASRELRKKGKDQVSAVLFISIPEVEVIVSH